MPEDLRAYRLAMALHAAAVSVATAESFATGVPVPQALRLALGSVPLDKLQFVLVKVRQQLDAIIP